MPVKLWIAGTEDIHLAHTLDVSDHGLCAQRLLPTETRTFERSIFFFVLILLLGELHTPYLLFRLQALSPDLLLRGASLTDEDRSQIEERMEQLVHDNPTLSPTNARILDSKTEPPSVSVEVLDEYYFLKDMVA